MCIAAIKWKMRALNYILHKALNPPHAHSGIVRPLDQDDALTIHIQFIIHQSSYSPPRRGECVWSGVTYCWF
jgi:hypothetical protein